MTALAETPERPYPYVRVILCFSLLGAPLGSAILGIAASVFTMRLESGFTLEAGSVLIMVFVLVGSVVGLVPAVLCGIWLAVWRVHRTWLGIFNAFVSGGLLSWLCTVAVLASMGGETKIFIPGAWILIGAGGGSALILALLVLPRKPRDMPGT